MSELDDEECNRTNLSRTDGCWALSVSRILRDLKQPAAPPSEARICAVITPFFMSSKCLNGNLCLFSLLPVANCHFEHSSGKSKTCIFDDFKTVK